MWERPEELREAIKMYVLEEVTCILAPLQLLAEGLGANALGMPGSSAGCGHRAAMGEINQFRIRETWHFRASILERAIKDKNNSGSTAFYNFPRGGGSKVSKFHSLKEES